MAGINVLLKISLDYVYIHISILSQITRLVQISPLKKHILKKDLLSKYVPFI